MAVTNAIQYLKENNFADNKANSWINPVLNKALNGDLTKEDVDIIINNIVKSDNKPEQSQEIEALTAVAVETASDNISIKEIKEISEVSNFGLLSISQPILLNGNLNIFYGLNGVGKSSIYKSICGALGHKDRKCIPNVDSNSDKMVSKIKILDKTSAEKTLEFSVSTKNSLDVRIFDSYISNFIVSNDHENEFEVPYLKQEYFIVLRNLLDDISERLITQRNSIFEKTDNTKQLLKDKLDFLDESYKVIQEKIKGVKFSDDDQKILDKLISDKLALESDKNDLLLKTYKERLEELDNVLNKLCVIKVIDGNQVYENKYTDQFINRYKVDLGNYIKCKEIYECNNINKIGEFISEDWLKKKEWYTFIEAGISFVSSLTKDEQLIYPNERCPYCNQDLDIKSKELIKSYNNIMNTCKADMDKHKNILDSTKKVIVDLIQYVDEIGKAITKTFEHIKVIDDKQVNDFNQSVLKSYLEALNIALEKYEPFIDEGKSNFILMVNRIIEFRKILNDKVIEVSKQTLDKVSDIKRIVEVMKPLEISKVITLNISKLEDLIEKLRILEDIDTKTSSITKLKTNLSKHQTNFASESIVKLFKEKLYEEYEELNFKPPEKLTIKPKVKSRLCRIGNYRINEIYSEGELKIHALAEFFATCTIDNFKGVYIFDDPVNSLDYERIDYVKDRILRLVKEGNQVFIFTHNIYFLYSLMEPKIITKVNEVIKGDYEIQIISNTEFGKEKEFTDKRNKIDKKMKDFAKCLDKGKIDISDLSSVYDLMSGCLESYVETKLLYNIISRYRPNIRMDNLEDLKRLDIDKLDRVNSLYRKTSRYGNRHDRPLSAMQPQYCELEKHFEQFKEIVS